VLLDGIAGTTPAVRRPRYGSCPPAGAVSKLKNLDDSLKIAEAKYNGLKLNIATSNKSIDAVKQIFARFPAGCITPIQKKHIDNLFKTSKQDLTSQIQLPKDVKPNTAAVTGANPPPVQTDNGHPTTTTIVQPTNLAVINYPGDPQKGKWGMKSEVNGRKVTAEVSKRFLGKLYEVVITISSTDDSKPLKEPIRLHLPDSFPDPNPVAPGQLSMIDNLYIPVISLPGWRCRFG